MNVGELGEFRLIEVLAKVVREWGVAGRQDGSLILGIGDDAAAWRTQASVQVATTDTLVDGVHFSLDHVPWRDLGWKALAVNVSDIAAMGATPRYAVISLGLPPETDVDGLKRLYEGMAELASDFGLAIAGGDISMSPVLTITPTVFGEAEDERLLTRSGAAAGDQIAVTGYLGGSAAGLSLLRSGLDSAPQLRKELLEAHLRPYPRVGEGTALARAGVRAAVDVSDGLIADLTHMCRASGVGAEISLDRVPVPAAAATVFGEDAIHFALSGGEDYELAFTAPLQVIEDVRNTLSVPVTLIGEVVAHHPGEVIVRNRDGTVFEYPVSGWEHFGQ